MGLEVNNNIDERYNLENKRLRFYLKAKAKIWFLDISRRIYNSRGVSEEG
jgi:hypothetical protein